MKLLEELVSIRQGHKYVDIMTNKSHYQIHDNGYIFEILGGLQVLLNGHLMLYTTESKILYIDGQPA